MVAPMMTQATATGNGAMPRGAVIKIDEAEQPKNENSTQVITGMFV